MKIFTVFKGEIREAELISETTQGFRVKPENSYSRVVWKDRQMTGQDGAMPFHRERSFLEGSKKEAIEYAKHQIRSQMDVLNLDLVGLEEALEQLRKEQENG